MSDARVLAAAVDELRSAVAPDRVVVDEEKLQAYGRDESELGVYPPEVVAFVEGAEEVRRIFAIATRHRLPVVPMAARSGKTGGSLALHGGISVSAERMNSILEIRPEDLTARVQPGVITGGFQAEVEKHGLF